MFCKQAFIKGMFGFEVGPREVSEKLGEKALRIAGFGQHLLNKAN